MAWSLTATPVSTSGAFRTNTSLTFASAPPADALVVIALMHENKSAISATAPTGFTVEGSVTHSVADMKVYVAWGFGNGTTTTFTWTHGNAWTQGGAWYATGNATSSIIDGTTQTGQATNGTSYNFGTITTAVDNSLLVAVGFNTSETTTTASYTSPLAEVLDATVVDMGAGALATAGSSGAMSASTSLGNLAWVMFAVKEAAGGPPQTLAPNTTESAGNWTTDTGATTNLHLAVDETTASDTDYIQSELSPDASPVLLGLASGSDPAVSTGHEINFRYRKSVAEGEPLTLYVELYQGATLIATRSYTDISNAWTDGTIALTGTEADTITDYANLDIRLTAERGVS